jgi:hypothetical protein
VFQRNAKGFYSYFFQLFIEAIYLALLEKLANKAITKQTFCSMVEANFDLLPEVIDGLRQASGTVAPLFLST